MYKPLDEKSEHVLKLVFPNPFRCVKFESAHA